MGQIGAAFNDLVEMNARSTKELGRVARLVGREGRMTERFSLPEARGAWREKADSVNELIDDLSRPTTEVARVIESYTAAGATSVILQPTGDDPDVDATLALGAEAIALLAR